MEVEVRTSDGPRAKIHEMDEIYAKGNNIILSYWQGWEVTNKALTEGWLQTSDHAHDDENEYIYIHGRSSDMIKSGANRISPK